MKHSYQFPNSFFILVFILFAAANLSAQIVNIPDANLKTKLLNYSPPIDINGDGEIQVSEAEAVTGTLNLSNLNGNPSAPIANPTGLEAFVNLTGLNMDNNSLTYFGISTLTDLEVLRLSNNEISSVDLSALVNLEQLNLSNNQLSTLDVSALTNLVQLNVNINWFNSIDVSALTNLEVLNITNNSLSSLDVSALTNLQELYVYANNLSAIDVSSLVNLKKLYVSSNNLSSLDVSNLTALEELSTTYNPITSLDVSTLINLESLGVGGNQLTSLDVSNLTNLLSLSVAGNPLTELDVSNNPNLEWLTFYGCPNLTYVNMKNGNNVNMEVGGEALLCPNLEKLCVDNVQYFYDTYNIPQNFDAYITAYCSFDPAQSNTITGQLNMDVGDGCTASTAYGFPNALVRTEQNGQNNATFTDSVGDYTLHLGEGTSLTSVVENFPPYFSVSPNSETIDFTGFGNSEVIDFCIEPTMAVEDLNITIIPAVMPPRPGQYSVYEIGYENIGTSIVGGQITFEFDETKQSFFSATIPVSASGSNWITFDFFDLKPMESRSFGIKLYTEEPPIVNAGDILNFTATITPNDNDYTPANNISQLTQTVVNSYDPNDKIVLEGEEILIGDADEYLHYLIRFQNTGTAAALNVVVTDTLSELLDWNSIRMVTTSHDYSVRITDGNFVEFIFEDINLPFEAAQDSASHGFVAYKIKPKDNIQIGDIISGEASIYFDLNPPIVTNSVSTEVVENLSVADFGLKEVRLYPNPTSGIVHISTEKTIEKVVVFSLTGKRVVQQQGNFETINLENLSQGVYFVEISTKNGKKTVKKLVRK